MNVRITPGPIGGSVAAPPSKSVMQRVLAAIFLRNASIRLLHPGYSADDEVLLEILRKAGFLLHQSKNVLDITSPALRKAFATVHFGESGLAARMMSSILALDGQQIQLDAAKGLQSRPMHFIDEVLSQLRVKVKTTDGHLPALIQGPLRPSNISVDAALSSQILTGLLMAYAGAEAKDVKISLEHLVSKPYIDLTLHVMELMGLPVPENNNYESFYFPSESSFRSVPREVRIEGDWSGAAFMLIAGAISGRVRVTELNGFSVQGDKAVLTALAESGAQLSIEATRVTVAPAKLRPFQIDATDTPDLFPPLAVLACYAHGTSAIEGVGRLRHKESDRATTIFSELSKMGANITVQDDLMIIRGGTPLLGASVSAHNDHRIAMMCAVAALGAKGITTIADAAAVSKSYPSFFEDLRELGAQINIAG